MLGVMVEPSDVEVKRVEHEELLLRPLRQKVKTCTSASFWTLTTRPPCSQRGWLRCRSSRSSQTEGSDLAIEATIDLEIWLTNAPEMMPTDEQWVATETRAAGCVFHGSTIEHQRCRAV